MKTLVWLVPLTTVFLLLFSPAAPSSAARAPTGPACTTASPAANGDPTATVCISGVNAVGAGTWPGNGFTVSWISATPQTGRVQLVGAATAFNDARGANYSGTTHYVPVSNLVSNTSYQFDIVSGGNTFDNNGQHWKVTVPQPMNATRGAIPLTGRVKGTDGNNADEAIIYITLQSADGSANSALLAQVWKATDFSFAVPLNYARTSDYSAAFSYDKTKDKAIITANSGDGFASTTVVIANAQPPQPNPPNVTLTLGSGYVSVSTATPSPIPPTSTATPITPSATPTLIPATATAVAVTQTAASFTSTPTRTRRPPTATPEPPTETSVPTETPVTLAPADETQIAEATVENSGEASPEATSLRVAPRTSPTPNTSGLFGGLTLVSLLPIVAGAALLGAIALVIVALVIWKR